MTNIKKTESKYEAYLLLYESERMEDDDVWVGIYTDVKLLMGAYEKLLVNNVMNMPVRVYGFTVNTNDTDPEHISLEALRNIA